MSSETYKQATTRLLAALQSRGWETRPNLKRPWAQKDGVRIEFGAQSVYHNGHSMFIDTRGLSIENFLASVKRWTEVKGA